MRPAPLFPSREVIVGGLEVGHHDAPEGIEEESVDDRARPTGISMEDEVWGARARSGSTGRTRRSLHPTFLHLDWWPGNLLWEVEEISTVVDWDEATYGDDAIDVAYARMDLVLLGMDDATESFTLAHETVMGQSLASLTLRDVEMDVRQGLPRSLNLERPSTFGGGRLWERWMLVVRVI